MIHRNTPASPGAVTVARPNWRAEKLPALARDSLLFLIPAIALYWMTAAWPETPDGWLHLQRVRALAEALRMGVVFPRWFPDFSFGYGYPVLNFYAPAFYYLPASLNLLGIDVLQAVRISLAVVFGLSSVGMFRLLRSWTTFWPALAGTVLYLAFPYRLYDLFVRGALPEFAAFLWLPLIVLFSIRLHAGSAANNETSDVSSRHSPLATRYLPIEVVQPA